MITEPVSYTHLAVYKRQMSELAEEGQGEWTGEQLEIIFEGEEDDASEIFGKDIVTSEGGDSMTYYKRGFQ